MTCRLLYVVGQLGAGGSERQLCYLLRSMDRERYRPAVAVWNTAGANVYLPPIRELGVPVYWLAEGRSAPEKLRLFRRLVKQLDPELVHSYSFYLNFAAHWSARGTRAIAFGSSRSNFIFDWKGSGWWLARLSARWPRHQIYNSYDAARAVSRSKSFFAPGRVFVIHNGVDLDHFRESPLQPEPYARILGIGSLLPVKRWDRLLLAAIKLKQAGLKFSLHIVGEGPLRQWLGNMAAELGLKEVVRFAGYVEDVAGLISGSTFLAHTSDVEGCPNAVMEAMACGRPIVATDVGDVGRLVDNGRSGFVVPCGHQQSLIENMAKLITNPNLCRRMGEAARQKAEREFGLDRLVNQTLEAYEQAGWKRLQDSRWRHGLQGITGPQCVE